MSHCKRKRMEPVGWVPVECGIQKREKRGYKAEFLSDELIHFYIPNKEDQHFVYITGPIGDDLDSWAVKVGHYALKAWENESVPVCPLLMYASMFCLKDRQTFANAQMFSLMILMHCDELWLMEGDRDDSRDHVYRELEMAAQMDIPVRYISMKNKEEETDE